MGEDDRFEALAGATTSFSQLLFADDENDDASIAGLGSTHVFDCGKTPQMLCFGERALISEMTTRTKSSLTCSDSSSSASASSTNNSMGTISKSNTRKRSGEGKESGQCPEKAVANANQRLFASKKTKTESPNATGPTKRKEKLGERIAALQQLVSPFGKTDTASVLHEAMGYIRFLQEQVQVLCSPYFQRYSISLPISEKEESESGGVMKDLRSRGLCLVPLECTVHVADTNGADFWSSSTASNVITSSATATTKQLHL